MRHLRPITYSDLVLLDAISSNPGGVCPKCGGAIKRERTDDGCPFDVLGGPRFWWMWTCDKCGWCSREEQE